MDVTTAAVDLAAGRLIEAAALHRPCLPVRDILPWGDVAVAYAVQQQIVAGRLGAGAASVGRKIGLTNPAVQEQLGVDQPDFGVLLADMAIAAGGVVPAGRTLQPRVEAEIIFRLAADLVDPGTDEAAVSGATLEVAPALEIVDSRIAGWDITIVDTVADNASSGLFVIGSTWTPLAGLDLSALSMTMWRSGTVVSTGTGADCMGDPRCAVAWLARTAATLGDPLRAGDLVLSGALGPMVAARPGDEFNATIDGLGDVAVSFERVGS
jgi:2-keto-4-pentenoate hydratase